MTVHEFPHPLEPPHPPPAPRLWASIFVSYWSDPPLAKHHVLLCLRPVRSRAGRLRGLSNDEEATDRHPKFRYIAQRSHCDAEGAGGCWDCWGKDEEGFAWVPYLSSMSIVPILFLVSEIHDPDRRDHLHCGQVLNNIMSTHTRDNSLARSNTQFSAAHTHIF